MAWEPSPGWVRAMEVGGDVGLAACGRDAVLKAPTGRTGRRFFSALLAGAPFRRSCRRSFPALLAGAPYCLGRGDTAAARSETFV